jgi:hypothetical protein
MANWKKVIVSGSSPEFAALQVDNLTSGSVVIGGGAVGDLTSRSINGTGNILATTGATGVVMTGSFTGSFAGDGSGLTGVTAAAGFSLSQGSGIVPFSYNGASTQSVAVSGAAQLSSNAVTKWNSTDGKFVNSSITDNGSLVSIVSDIEITGSFSLFDISSSFTIDGNIFGQTYLNSGGALVLNPGFGGVEILGANAALKVNGNIVATGTSSSLTGSLLGTASYADRATSASYADFAGAGSGSFTGSFTGSFAGDGSQLTGIATVLAVSGSTGDGTVNLKTQALTIAGTSNEIETSVAGQTVTIGLPNNVTIAGNLNVNNNLTVLGTASFQNTENLQVADRFILLASGSNTTGDGGLVVQQGTQDVGELFAFDSGVTRWAFTGSFNAGSSSFTPDAFVAAAVIGTGIDPTAIASRYQAGGNIFIGTDQEIWIYS